ncbi:MAG: GNAT family N-acetyltransferase [Pseudomonadota bacterium]
MQIEITLPVGQRRAGPSDARRVGDLIAKAFETDPVNLYVFGRARAIQSGMRILARSVYVPAGYSFLQGDDGATMWLPPGASPGFGWLAQLTFAVSMNRFATKGAMKRAMGLSAQMSEHHPTAPHMYLFTIGAVPEARGKGIGKSLLEPVLMACDRDGVPVYLENSNPVNCGFYRAHGFETITRFQVGGDGPVMEPMWRAPQSTR